MDKVPSGAVTFLFTDVEGSTRLWEESPEAMKSALAVHDACLRDAVVSNSGRVVKSTGDGLLAVFSSARDAALAAVAGQRALAREDWAGTGPLLVRMGLNTGVAEHRDGDYFGVAANRAARLTEAANGGQVLMSNATTALLGTSLPAGVGLVALGQHRLRDLSRLEGVFQLTIVGLRHDFPPCRWADELLGNLPVRLTSFVGRQRDLATITREVGKVPVVTISGTAGVGKTRLAIESAVSMVDAHPDGVWFCDFAGVGTPEELTQVTAATLRVQVRPGSTLDDAVVEHLGTKHLLLIFDNCEHLLDAASTLAKRIVLNCPYVRILATSREAFGIDSERICHLPPFAVPDRDSDEGTLAENESIVLFVDRARARQPHFVVNESTLRVVGEICRQLDGIPLAIELAAARVVSMSPTEILERLRERFRLLTRPRASSARHQTLRNAVEWSYALLDPGERLVFDRLGAFVGGFDATAAKAVVDPGEVDPLDIIDSLDQLVAKSMVVADVSGPETRYRLLETLRQFARESLEVSGTLEACRRRHACHYASLARSAGQGLEGPDELTWRRRIAAELDELRAVVAWALDSTGVADQELGFDIVNSLYYESVADASSGIGSWAARCADRSVALTPKHRRGILAGAAMDAYARGDYRGARDLGARATDGDPSPGSAGGILPYAAVSLTDVQSGDMERALRFISHGIAAVDASDACFRDRADARTLGALCAVFAGADAVARQRTHEALELAERSACPSAHAHALAVLGNVLDHDDPEAALAALDESVSLTEAGASDFAAGTALRKAAELRAWLGDAIQAVSALRESIAHEYERGSMPPLLYTIYVGSEVLADLGHAEPAAVLAGAVTTGPAAPFVAERIQTAETARTERLLGRLESVLGLENYRAAFARGVAMPYDELVAYALDQLGRI